MSGQAGARGYLIQAVIAVLDALHEHEWTECILEPNVGDDKVDLVLRSSGGDRVSQIKSSENAIGVAQVRAWVRELETAYPGAKRYELRLIGPVTAGAASVRRVGNVDVPVPEAVNIRALIERCAHRLDRYLRDLGHGPIRPAAREFLAQALTTRLATSSATGAVLSREALEKLLADWVAELLPPDAAEPSKQPDSEMKLPGWSLNFYFRVHSLPVTRRKYLLDIGKTDGERLSVYISKDNIFTMLFVDAKGEPHPLRVPFGGGGFPISQFVYFCCEMGIGGTTTRLNFWLNGQSLASQTLPFKTDMGKLDLPNGVLGADLNGADSAVFDLGQFFCVSNTMSKEELGGLVEYFESKADQYRKTYLEFSGGKWMRITDAPTGNRHALQPDSEKAPVYRTEI
jgi:hypothetical protein